MLNVTNAAKEKFTEFLADEGKKDAYIRIYVSGVGWGGPKYGLTLEESIQEDKDIIEESGEIKIVFDKGISSFLEGKSVDFVDGPRGGFAITDPGAEGSCGDCSC
jgi:iron-sulfur cluster assembly accessory protein